MNKLNNIDENKLIYTSFLPLKEMAQEYLRP